VTFNIPLNVTGVLGITPRPRGGDWLDDELRTLATSGIHVLVSLLESLEAQELGLEGEAALCASNGLEFVNVPIPDLGVPDDFAQFARVAAEVDEHLRAGRRVAVHCRQSVGRSGLFAVSLAVMTGLDLPSAIEAVSTARGIRVPETPTQLAWLRQHQSQLSRLAG
jgi:protein-tyrosine phosphatase